MGARGFELSLLQMSKPATSETPATVPSTTPPADPIALLAQVRDESLGGRELDDALVERLVRACEGFDPRRNQPAMQQLREAAERARCELSSAAEAEVSLPHLMRFVK